MFSGLDKIYNLKKIIIIDLYSNIFFFLYSNSNWKILNIVLMKFYGISILFNYKWKLTRDIFKYKLFKQNI